MEDYTFSNYMQILQDSFVSNEIEYDDLGVQKLCRVSAVNENGEKLFAIGLHHDTAMATMIAIRNVLSDAGMLTLPPIKEVFLCPVGRFRGQDVESIPIEFIIHWSENDYCDDPVIDRFIRKCKEIVSNIDPLDLL